LTGILSQFVCVRSIHAGRRDILGKIELLLGHRRVVEVWFGKSTAFIVVGRRQNDRYRYVFVSLAFWLGLMQRVYLERAVEQTEQ
jgi:hypothetical protein